MLTIDQILKAGEKILNARKQEAKEYACWRFGYNDSGYTYILLEELTDMERKEGFKQKGGFYDKFLGWHSPRKVDGYRMKRVKMDDIAEFSNGRWWTQKYKVDEFRRMNCMKRIGKRAAVSDFIGVLGENGGVVSRMRLVSVKETMFRDRNYDRIGYYGLPYKWDYRFVDKDGNIAVFSSAYYNANMVKEWFGKGWADVVAKAIRFDESHGVKITRIAYPEFSKRGKVKLSEYARIKNPKKCDGEMPTELIACDS